MAHPALSTTTSPLPPRQSLRIRRRPQRSSHLLRPLVLHLLRLPNQIIHRLRAPQKPSNPHSHIYPAASPLDPLYNRLPTLSLLLPQHIRKLPSLVRLVLTSPLLGRTHPFCKHPSRPRISLTRHNLHQAPRLLVSPHLLPPRNIPLAPLPQAPRPTRKALGPRHPAPFR